MSIKKRRKINWSIISPFISIIFVIGTSILVILYGRGYRVSMDGENIIQSTGMLAATSDPVGAQIFVNGTIKTATNASFSLDPGNHTIKIAKDGFLPWQKDILIEKEVVSRADAFLFPINPSLSPLTNRGVIKPTLSPDGSKIAYISPSKEENGQNKKGYMLWIHELTDRTLGFNRDSKEIGFLDSLIDIQNLSLHWSPNSNEILVSFPTFSRLYNLGRPNDTRIITQEEKILEAWKQEEIERQQRQLLSFKQEFINIATSSAKIIQFSPDETKVLYEATQSAVIPKIINPSVIGANSTKEERMLKPENLYVYDSKEDKNYFLFDKHEILQDSQVTPTPTQSSHRKQLSVKNYDSSQKTNRDQEREYPLSWFPTNRHILLVNNKKIDVVEYDRTNWVTIYAGPFEDTFIAPWSGGSRIVILTNLNPNASPLPNLFTVNLR